MKLAVIEDIRSREAPAQSKLSRYISLSGVKESELGLVYNQEDVWQGGFKSPNRQIR